MPSQAEQRNDNYQRLWARLLTGPYIFVTVLFAGGALFFFVFGVIKYDPHTFIWFELIALVMAGFAYDTWMRFCQAEWAPREFSKHDGASDWATLDEVAPLFGSKKNEAPRTQRDLLRDVSTTSALVHRG